jgi:lipid A oxidase
MSTRFKAFVIAAAALVAAPAAAEMEISVYTGHQSLPHSRLTGSNPVVGAFARTVKLDGKSFVMPPYYGVRAMWWRDSGLGFGVEYTHTKAYAPDADKTALGFTRLEFSDGHNVITANVAKRWANKWGKLTPYVGAGIGIAMPHVDALDTAGNKTFGFQYAGPAMRLTAGAKYDINNRWATYGEYQFTASQNNVDLAGGGNLSARLITNAFNVGVMMKF